VEALCGLVNSPDMLTRRYAVGAIRNLAVNKDARHIFHGHTAMMGQVKCPSINPETIRSSLLGHLTLSDLSTDADHKSRGRVKCTKH